MMFYLTAQLEGLLPRKFFSHKREIPAFSLTSYVDQTPEASLFDVFYKVLKVSCEGCKVSSSTGLYVRGCCVCGKCGDIMICVSDCVTTRGHLPSLSCTIAAESFSS